MRDPRLARLFDISRMDDTTFQLVQHMICPNSTTGASYELLAGIAARSCSSMVWSPFRSWPKEKLIVPEVEWTSILPMQWQVQKNASINLFHAAFVAARLEAEGFAHAATLVRCVQNKGLQLTLAAWHNPRLHCCEQAAGHPATRLEDLLLYFLYFHCT